MKIKTLCDFLFFDQFQETATFLRFEQCFQPLFNNVKISIQTVFKDICGPKKKYITYKRFAKAYRNHINGNDISQDTKLFFDKLLNSILKEENSFMGTAQGNIHSYSTKKTSKNRDCVSLVQILCDKKGIFHGMNVEYDGVFKNKMYSELEKGLLIFLDMKLGIIDERPKIIDNLRKYPASGQGTYRDAITHIFGTIDSGNITFLGFKCFSGKTSFVGFPKGEGFLYGKFGYKLHNLKIQIDKKGITMLKPGFKPNLRKNFFLDKIAGKLSEQNLDEEETIKDEECLNNINDNIEIEKFITTPIIEDEHFFKSDLIDEISGSDYKEVIDLYPRQWIMNSNMSNEDNKKLTLEEALNLYDKEYEERSGNQGEVKSNNNANKTNNNENISSLPKTGTVILHKSKIFKNLNNNLLAFGNKAKAAANQLVGAGKLNNNIKKSILLNKENLAGIKDKIEYQEEKNFVKKSILNDIITNSKSNKNAGKSKNAGVRASQITIKNLKGEVKNSEEQQANRSNPEKKWKDFKEGVEKKYGVYFWRTLGSVIRATHILADDEKISPKEQKKWYKIMQDNEKIVDFLSQGVPEDDAIVNVNIYDLYPDEHPERTTTLSKLQNTLDNIKELLSNQNLNINEENRKKLEQLYDLYFQQKNILIENKNKAGKTELIAKYNINVDKYIKEEEEKRGKGKEEEEKKLEEELKKNNTDANKKNEPTLSIIHKNVTTKIYNKQKMPKPLSLFNDQTFPPKKVSLCPFTGEGWTAFMDLFEEDIQEWENYKWCRIDELGESLNYDIFTVKANVDNIKQGDINDCYFLSAVGALCNYPDFFYRLFQVKEKTKEGAYGVYLYLNGKWKLVLVDDNFPYAAKYRLFKQLSFSSTVRNEIWISLLEKAWAKVNGCYVKIGCGGYTYEAFDVLTEAYIEKVNIREYNLNKEEELWMKMDNGFQSHYILTAETPNNEELANFGLCPNHIYSVMNIYKIGQIKLVKLRTPWGSMEYTGDWSIYDSKWTPDIKSQCQFPKDEDNGTFYMSYNDFTKYFLNLNIVKLEPGYKTTYIKIKKEKVIKCQFIKININEDNPRTYIQLYQKNPRILRQKGQYYPEPVMGYMILVDSEFKYIKSVCGRDMHLGIEADLKQGTYYVICDVNYRNEIEDNKNYGYTVTFYAKNLIKNIVNVTERIDVISALEMAMYSYCRQKVEQNNDESGVRVFDSKASNKEIPFRIFCFINLSKNPLKVKLDIDFTDRKYFCIYNDRVASEFDSSVIKRIEPENATIILIMDYFKKSKYEAKYEILPNSDERTYENTHYVFKEEAEEFDDKGRLMSYYINIEEYDGYDKGYAIGLENTTNIEYNLKLILEGVYDVDGENKGKEVIDFKIPPKGKKVFNARFKPEIQDASFDFKLNK